MTALWVALQSLSLLAAVPLVPRAQGAVEPPAEALAVLAEFELPEVAQEAFDLRWASDESFVIAAAKAGVFEVPAKAGEVAARQVIAGYGKPGGFWLSSRVGVSDRFLVVAATAFNFAWQRREAETIETLRGLEMTLDLDLQDDRLAILGARKGPEGMVPKGEIAWVGSLEKDLADLQPIHFSAEGPGAPRMNECGLVELGGIRILADGSILVVPGVDPGIYWYEADGRLRRTWQNESVGLDDGCPPSEEARREVTAKPQPRYAWWNRNRLLDDVIALGNRAGLLVRIPDGKGTRWQLVLLESDGKVSTVEIPIVSQTGLSHLRGDVRNGKIAFLVSEHGEHGPTVPSRVVITTVPP